MDEQLDALIDEERYEEALQFLIENEHYFMDREDLLSKKAWLFNRLERHQEALHTLEELQTFGQPTAWFYSELGFTYSRLNRFDEALNAFFEAQDLGRDDVWLDCEIASVYGSMEYFEEAKEFLVTAFDKEPENIWINSQLGYTYLHLNDRQNALAYYENAFELGRRDSWLLSECVWVANKLNQHDKALRYLDVMNELEMIDDWSCLEYAVAYNGKGEYQKALDFIQQISQTDLQGYTLEKAFALSRVGKEKEALELYESIEYKDAFIQTEMAYIYSKSEDYEAERPYILKAIELGRKDYWVLGELAKITSYQDKDYAKAIEYLKEALEVSHNNTWATAEIAWNYKQLRIYESALEWLDTTVEWGRDDVWVNLEYADIYENMDDFEKAYQFVLKAEKKGANGTRFLSRKAYYMRMQDRYHEALDLYKTIDRQDAWIFNEFAYCYGELEDYDISISYYQKALELEPNNGFALTKLSWTYGTTKQHQKAIECLLRCLEVIKPTAWLYGQFAYNYYCIGSLSLAKKYAGLALELDKDDEWLKGLWENIERKSKNPKLFRK